MFSTLRLRLSSVAAPRICLGTQRRMLGSLGSVINNPIWENKMKMRFKLLDFDKNGILDDNDVFTVAKRVASFRGEGSSDAVKKYSQILRSVTGLDVKVGKKEYNEDEFVQEARQIVQKPDAAEWVKDLADMVFEVVDADKNGEISYDEYRLFYLAFNAEEKLIDTFFKEADINGDGAIELSECRESYKKYFFTA